MAFEVDVATTFGNRRIAARFMGGAGVTALFGPSGIGKTTILNMIAGLVRPESGRIVVGGNTLFDSDCGIDLPPEQRRLGYVFQDVRLFPHRSVRANLTYGQHRAKAGESLLRFDEMVAFLGIGHLLHRRPGALSGGEAQRVAIGRALLAGPEYLLLDEPLSSLDEARREDILGVIARIATELGLPILYVTHDRREIDRLGAATVSLLPEPATML